MEPLYCRVHDWTPAECAQVWQKWVWRTDCNALPTDDCCDMNQMHGWGILCCIRESACPVPAYEQSVVEIAPDLPVLHLQSEKPVCEFSLRELMDQIECMQLNWGKIVGLTDDHGDALLRAVMARVGFITNHAFETHRPEEGYEGLVLDDPQHTTSLPGQTMAIIARKSLRQIVCVLVAMARVQSIAQQAVLTPSYSSEHIRTHVVQALKQHHIEASMDFFNGLQQMMHLAPGMRLVYRTNFAGMYNDVSQVIFFHYPKFARQPQRPLAEIPDSTMHLLPLLRELIPDVPLAYDDDSRILRLTEENEEAAGWLWLISCGVVFLVEGATGTIYQGATLVELLCFFLEKTERKLIVEAEDENDGYENNEERTARKKRKKRAMDAAYTEHGHIEMQ
jgi:hypothetical protein